MPEIREDCPFRKIFPLQLPQNTIQAVTWKVFKSFLTKLDFSNHSPPRVPQLSGTPPSHAGEFWELELSREALARAKTFCAAARTWLIISKGRRPLPNSGRGEEGRTREKRGWNYTCSPSSDQKSHQKYTSSARRMAWSHWRSRIYVLGPFLRFVPPSSSFHSGFVLHFHRLANIRWFRHPLPIT